LLFDLQSFFSLTIDIAKSAAAITNPRRKFMLQAEVLFNAKYQ